MMKLFIQFEDALIDVPLARIESGKISAIRVHDAGPQLYAKLKMYSQIMATAPHPAAACPCQSLWHLATMIPVISWHRNIPADPQIRRGLRPTLSITRIAGIVVTTLIIPTTPVAKSEMVLLVKPRFLKTIGA